MVLVERQNAIVGGIDNKAHYDNAQALEKNKNKKNRFNLFKARWKPKRRAQIFYWKVE